MRVYFTDGCPYAHRTRALLTLLEKPFEPVVVDLANKTPEFLALSPTAAVPLIDDDGFVLFESAVINEYLAEKYAWSDALSSDLKERAHERLAMNRFDNFVVPLFFAALKNPAALDGKPAWKREVELIGAAVKGKSPRSLLGLHLAPHWLRLNWLAPQSPMVKELQRVAGEYLGKALALPAVVATSPDRDATVKAIREKFGLKSD
jgi:glutaredoxin